MNSHRKSIQLLLAFFSFIFVVNLRAEIASSESTIYHADPDHLWNRLNKTLFMRTAQDGKNYGLNRVDILYWSLTRHLLVEPSHQQALAILDEFIETQGGTLIQEPIKRALLQRDLWQLFDWSVRTGQNVNYAQEREELQKRLAVAIRQLALSPDEIASLPDNYEQATQEQSPNLPMDLFQSDGDWINLGINDDKMVAPLHVEAFKGHSVFNIMIRLPGGRQTTNSYLDNLRAYEVNEPGWSPGNYSSRLPELHPNIPQFPPNTEWALVRRMCVIDNEGNIKPTPIIEEIQIRRYLNIEAMNQVKRDAQQFFQFELDRRRGGALRPIGENEKDFTFVHFQSKGSDLFESLLTDSSPDSPRSSLTLQTEVMQTCFICHSRPGIFSVNSYSRFFQPLYSSPPTQIEPAKLSEFDLEHEAELVIEWKQNQDSWELFQQLWRNADSP